MSPATETGVIDARLIATTEDRVAIFAAFEALVAGESFELLSDHEPRPLHGQLLAQWPGQFSWDVLQVGAARWRIRIGRLAGAKTCCGGCGG